MLKLSGRLKFIRNLDFERDLILVVAGLLVLFLAASLKDFGWPPRHWDVMLISGWAVFIVGLLMVRDLPARFEIMLDRLTRRGVIQWNDDRQQVTHTIRASAILWERIGALAVGIAIILAFLVAFWGTFSPERILLMIAQALAGAIAGIYLGRMCAFGLVGRLFKKQGAQIKAIPGHVDGASGMKPIGDYFFFQALVASVPATYFAIWLLLLLPVEAPTLTGLGRYHHWQTSYQGLLLLTILIEIGAFVLPMLRFHRIMAAEKFARLEEADRLAGEIAGIDAQLLGLLQASEATKALSERRATLVRQFDVLEKMPTWPVDIRTRRVFTLNNALLLVPLVFNLMHEQPPDGVKKSVEFAQKVLTGRE